MCTFTPYPHQEAGIEWIIQRPACALFWGMGSGKSATTLTAIDRLLNDYLEDGPVLVIAPKRVAENTWSKEAEKWEHLRHLRVSRIMGTAKQRLDALAAPADLYVINRENVVWLGSHWPFPIVVLDELSSFNLQPHWALDSQVSPRAQRPVAGTGSHEPSALFGAVAAMRHVWRPVHCHHRGGRVNRLLCTGVGLRLRLSRALPRRSVYPVMER